jgi:hypothetical protein
MKDKTKRMLLFLVGCVGIRYYLTKLVLVNNDNLRYILISLFTLISIGFMYIYITGSRKTGPETFGKPIWWNNLRPVHSILYGLTAFALLKHDAESASNLLKLDLGIGVMFFLMYHTNA